MGKELAHCFKIKKEQSVRQGNVLIFVKQSTRIVNYTKNMLNVPAKEISQSIQHNKQSTTILKFPRSTPTRFTLELDGHINLQQVSILAVAAER